MLRLKQLSAMILSQNCQMVITQLWESKGVHLSGGERQRIAIARAIIKDSPIIVLDEATAFSDPENEYLIQKAFEKLMQGKTVIIMLTDYLQFVMRIRSLLWKRDI